MNLNRLLGKIREYEIFSQIFMYFTFDHLYSGEREKSMRKSPVQTFGEERLDHFAMQCLLREAWTNQKLLNTFISL